MFVYFPELIYKFSKNFVKTTFSNEFDKNNSETIVTDIMSSDKVANMVSQFKKHRVKLPILQLNHCIQTDFIKPISNYDRLENTIEICKNLVPDTDKFVQTFIKELAYAFEFNINFSGKNLALSDYANICARACRISISNIENVEVQSIKSELVKRCAYNEFKYKFQKEIFDYSSDLIGEDLKINDLVKQLVDRNYSV